MHTVVSAVKTVNFHLKGGFGADGTTMLSLIAGPSDTRPASRSFFFIANPRRFGVMVKASRKLMRGLLVQGVLDLSVHLLKRVGGLVEDQDGSWRGIR